MKWPDPLPGFFFVSFTEFLWPPRARSSRTYPVSRFQGISSHFHSVFSLHGPSGVVLPGFYRVFRWECKKNKQQLIGGHQKRLYRVFFCEIAKLGFVTWKSRSSKSVTEFFACHFTEFFFVFFWPPQRSLDEQTRTGGFLNQPLLFLKRKKRKNKIFTVKKNESKMGKTEKRKWKNQPPTLVRRPFLFFLSFFFVAFFASFSTFSSPFFFKKNKERPATPSFIFFFFFRGFGWEKPSGAATLFLFFFFETDASLFRRGRHRPSTLFVARMTKTQKCDERPEKPLPKKWPRGGPTHRGDA